MRKKQILAALLTLTLAGGLYHPIPAEAASKQTLYVITSIKSTERDLEENENAGSSSSKISYNKNGLVATVTPSGSKQNKYTYTKKGFLKKIAVKNSHSATFTTNKKGVIKKENIKYKNSSVLSSKVTYTIKSGRITAYTHVEKYPYEGTHKDVFKFTYNKKGHVAKIKKNKATTNALSYDKYANLKTNTVYDDGDVYKRTYKNTYNKAKCLTKSVCNSSEELTRWTKTYKYKKISVPKNMVSRVKAQQWALINDNLNFAYGCRERYF